MATHEPERVPTFKATFGGVTSEAVIRMAKERYGVTITREQVDDAKIKLEGAYEKAYKGKLYPGPRKGGSPVYAQRFEALIECEAMAVRNFRREWEAWNGVRKYGTDRIGWTAEEIVTEKARFRERARRTLAGIRAMRMAIGEGQRPRGVAGMFW